MLSLMSTYRVWFIKKCINMHYFLIIVGCEATHKKKKKKRSKIFFANIQLFGCIVSQVISLMQAENNLTVIFLPNTKI